MMRMTQLGFTLTAGLLLAACASDPTIDREAAVTLEPMAKPASLPAESTWTGKGAGVIKLVANDGGKVSWAWASGSDEGCSWTDDGWFSPGTQWTNCNGGSGTQQISKEGDIWPLQIGSREVYDVQGKNNNNNTWETTRTCEVEDAVMIAIGERQLAAYEVVCTDSNSVRTWYVSPELQRVVRFRRVRQGRGVLWDITLQL